MLLKKLPKTAALAHSDADFSVRATCCRSETPEVTLEASVSPQPSAVVVVPGAAIRACVASFGSDTKPRLAGADVDSFNRAMSFLRFPS